MDDQEQEPISVHRTVPERVSAIEQWMRDHIRVANRGFEENRQDHRMLIERLNRIDAHLLEQDGLFKQYAWLARGVMVGLFLFGAFLGLITHPSWESLKTFVGLIK